MITYRATLPVRRMTLFPQRIGHIVTAILVVLTINGGRWRQNLSVHETGNTLGLKW